MRYNNDNKLMSNDKTNSYQNLSVWFMTNNLIFFLFSVATGIFITSLVMNATKKPKRLVLEKEDKKYMLNLFSTFD